MQFTKHELQQLSQSAHLFSPAAMAERLSRGDWRRALHLDHINNHLVEAARGNQPRLMIMAPPRHGKSELTSHWFPVWLFSLWPKKNIILSSYSGQFASEWGRKVRNTLAENSEMLCVQLSEDSKSASRWHTSEGGSMLAVGVGGPITGRGADVFIIDDPIANAEEAMSEVDREKKWRWYLEVARTRLAPGGVVVLMMTRWHEDDLAGRILTAEGFGGETFHVVRLPALAEKDDPLGRAEGEALWPSQFSRDSILSAVGQDHRMLTCLYQQHPTSMEGNVVKRDWWKRYDRLPNILEFDEIIASWDLATKSLDTSDPTAGHVLGRIGASVYLIDRINQRLDFPSQLLAIMGMRAKWPLTKAILIEDKSNGPAVIASLADRIPGIIGWPPRGIKMGSKEQRVSAISYMIQAGNVWIGPDHQAVIDEFADFPRGKHDDDVDALSQGLNYLQPRCIGQMRRDHTEALDDNLEFPDMVEYERARLMEVLKDRLKQIEKDDSMVLRQPKRGALVDLPGIN